MPDEDQAERRQPPPALPDGSMPTYDAHPWPGSADGSSPPTLFGWGPDLERLTPHQHTSHGPPPGESPILVAAAIVFGGLVLSVLIAVLAASV